MDKLENQPPYFATLQTGKQKFPLTRGRKIELIEGRYACNGCGGHKKTPSGFKCPVCDGKGYLEDA